VVVSEGGGNSFDEAVDIVIFCLFWKREKKKKFSERKTKTNFNSNNSSLDQILNNRLHLSLCGPSDRGKKKKHFPYSKIRSNSLGDHSS
jgi:hypothetical protein